MADGSLEHAAQVADVDGHGEDDGGVVLGRYRVYCFYFDEML